VATVDDSDAIDGKVQETEEAQDATAGQVAAHPEELKNLNYELLLIGFSVLSVINLVLLVLSTDPVITNILEIIDGPLLVIFFIDFLIRFVTAKSKRRYFFRQFGWADLASCIPFPAFNLLRTFRIVRAWRMISHIGPRNLARQIRDHRADAALSVIAFLIVVVLEFGGIFVIIAERRSPDANIKTASDAIWWAFVTITTVGYGDRYPVTNAGRIVGLAVMTTGVGLFGVLTGYLANAFLAPPKKSDDTAQNGAKADKTGQTEQTEQTVQPPAQLDTQAMLAEIQRLLSEQEKTQVEMRAMLAELQQTQGGASVAAGQ
jgi:voltage-gated potassium channel